MRNLAVVALVALTSVTFETSSAASLVRDDRALALAKRQEAKRAVNATQVQINSCPGYRASNVVTTSYSLTADLTLAGTPCNVYGPDITSLSLQVTYETGEIISVSCHEQYSNPV
jgi:hypothetical protein